MSDAVETIWQDMQQEPADELVGIECHAFLLAAMTMVPPAECNLVVGDADEPGIGDGDAMGIAGEISQHLLWSTEWLLGVNHPFDTADIGKSASESDWVRQVGKITEEAQLTGVKGRQ